MPELHLVNTPNKALPISVEKPLIETSKFVTAEQLDNKLGGVVDQIVNKMTPANAFTPEVSGVIKAVGQVQDLRTALKDPTSAGIEIATSDLVTKVLGNALQNMTGGGQQQAQPTPLKNTLAQIAVSNLTGENSPLPQLMDALTNILGKQKVREGYDAGMQYIDQQQRQNNLPATILKFDENSQEDVVTYAQQMGYSDVQYAQTKLIEHKNMLYQEIEEYQRVQGGGQQSTAVEEPVVQQEPVREQAIVQQEQYVQAEYEQAEYEKDPVNSKYSESFEPEIDKVMYEKEPIIEEPVIEEPVLKANKVIVLHGNPRKLTLVKDKVEQVINNDCKINVDENLNVDATYNEDNEDNEFLNDVDDILYEIGE